MKLIKLKKPLAAIISLVMLLSVLPTLAVSANTIFSLRYNLNGGTGSFADRTFGVPTTMMVSPVKPTNSDGSAFMGWAESADAEEATIQPGASIYVDSEITLYAVWKKISLSYDLMGGAGFYPPRTFTAITTAMVNPISPTPPTPTDQFRFWVDLSTGRTYSPGQQIQVDCEIVLTAIWRDYRYTVRYRPNDGLSPVLDTYPAYGENITISLADTFARPGYKFIGWNTEYDGSGIPYIPGAPHVVTGDLTLWAQWEKVNTVTFNVAYYGGIPVPAKPADQILDEGEKPIEPTEPIHADGCVFDGWYADAATLATNGWDMDDFADNEKKIIDGYLSILWDFDNNEVTGDLALFAYWLPNYTVVFSLAYGGTTSVPYPNVIKAEGSTVNEPSPEPEFDGFTFNGWWIPLSELGKWDAGYFNDNEEKDGWIKWDFDENVVMDDIVLYASWLPNYTVTFSFAYGGTSIIPAPKIVAKGHTVVEPTPEPEHIGKTFDGWWFDSNDASLTWYVAEDFEDNESKGGWIKWDFDKNKVLGDITLFASWVDHNIVTFDVISNGGSLPAPASQFVLPEGSKVIEPANPIHLAGFVFEGWWLYVGSGDWTDWDFEADTGAIRVGNWVQWNFDYIALGSITLVASWVIEYATISFDLHGGTAVQEHNPVDVERGKFLNPWPYDAPTKEGFVFGGWWDEWDNTDGATGTRYWPTTPINGNVTLHAKWTPVQCIVTFNVASYGGISVKPADQSVDIGTLATIPIPDPIHSLGLVFDGWYINASELIPPVWNLADFAGNKMKTIGGYPCIQWDFDNNLVMDGINLFAVWYPNYTVEFSFAYGGTAPAPDTKIVREGLTVAEPSPEPKLDGMYFRGWWFDSSTAGAWFDAEDFEDNEQDGSWIKWDFSKNIVLDDIVLYASWLPNHTVTFSLAYGGTTSVPEPAIVAHGFTVAEPTPEPEQIGKSFRGWWFDSSNVGWYNAEDFVNNVNEGVWVKWDFDTNKVLGDIILYASWTDHFEVVFDVITNGGNAPAPAVQLVPPGGGKVTAPPNATHPLDLTFNGWWLYVGSGYWSGWDFESDASVIRVGDWIQWKFNDYFAIGNITLVATWIPKYTVYFNLQGGTAVVPHVPVKVDHGGYLNPWPYANPTKAGYEFGGWFTAAGGGGVEYTTATPIIVDTVLHAKWTPAQCTVTFDVYGGDAGSGPSDQTVSGGSLINDPVVIPTHPDNMKFDGWWLDTSKVSWVDWDYESDYETFGRVGDWIKWDFDNYQVYGDMDLCARWIVPDRKLGAIIEFWVILDSDLNPTPPPKFTDLSSMGGSGPDFVWNVADTGMIVYSIQIEVDDSLPGDVITAVAVCNGGGYKVATSTNGTFDFSEFEDGKYLIFDVLGGTITFYYGDQESNLSSLPSDKIIGTLEINFTP